jgi:acyl-[acyl carrier protein]--UDP-N-acetylglucosamine O-acyltransferase
MNFYQKSLEFIFDDKVPYSINEERFSKFIRLNLERISKKEVDEEDIKNQFKKMYAFKRLQEKIFQ